VEKVEILAEERKNALRRKSNQLAEERGEMLAEERGKHILRGNMI
jgi:hypothetical protein